MSDDIIMIGIRVYIRPQISSSIIVIPNLRNLINIRLFHDEIYL